MPEPTYAPYITARRCRRSYGLMGRQVHDLSNMGDIWISRRNGIVIYRNDSYPEADPNHLTIVPRDITIADGRIPGLWPPPPSYSVSYAQGEWVAVDWLRGPKKQLDRDPRISCFLWMRRRFFELRVSPKTNSFRAYDIWPQPGQRSIIWPWEPKRFKKKA
jgi:hypothetical protein